ncbi:MAG: hypothetical protein KF886_21790 [Candidatus Hydrogenedentes bacterium]|nr:hypothetical protein [Candidatus Hydrogenedentota bacterium]
MEQKPRNRWSTPVALTVLVLLVAAWVANALHLRRLERELALLSSAKLDEFQQPGEGGPAIGRMAADVVASKPWVFWGTPSGKISVYVEYADTNTIDGFEFFFTREASGVWTQTESGRCASEECTVRGKELLDALDAKF